ncbi:uncharacterized protein N7515_005235 [Penicillium bovifimosum]|uniref:Transposase Tc1-like domain-containing protein n=1 Tax=Penicillium bovifimosum TaxID=126998 RepID=A0A9W9GSN5_9EURO|nr:uncharacterized protein N7515_005235 [Penicillium bovifimosum]KAJ5129196.1 hypothetical protein N7515_005235 [Penicillium bovifimosum]
MRDADRLRRLPGHVQRERQMTPLTPSTSRVSRTLPFRPSRHRPPHPATPDRASRSGGGTGCHSHPFAVLSQAEIGIPTATIARHFGLSPSTIQYTLEQEHARADGKTCPRSGRPPILSEGDKRLILRLIKRDPFIVYREIRDQSGLTASDDTLLRLVKSSGYGHWKARKRPFLTPEVAAPRYKWALAHRNWMWDDWMRVVWSDECSVEIGKGKRHRWVFHLNHTNKKYKKEHVITYRKSKGLSIMIWGAIWGGGSSKIYQMVRDEAFARNGYSARSYLDVLEGNLPQILDDTNRIFMQDVMGNCL